MLIPVPKVYAHSSIWPTAWCLVRDLHFLLTPVPKVYAHVSMWPRVWHLMRDLTFSNQPTEGWMGWRRPPLRHPHAPLDCENTTCLNQPAEGRRGGGGPPSATTMHVGV